MSTESQFYFPGTLGINSAIGDSQSFFVSAESQFHFSGNLDAASMIDSNLSLFDHQHGIFGGAGGATAEEGSHTQVSTFDTLQSNVDATAPSILGEAHDGPVADSAGSWGFDGADSQTTSIGHNPIDHTNGLDIQLNDSFLVDQPLNQLASFSAGGATSGWSGISTADYVQVQHFETFDGSPAAATGPSFAPDFSTGFIDAKGGNGGTHGGGGGGSGGGGSGGGGGLLTSYTSGDPNVSDANEFNIHIDFGGSWTSAEQAIVTWAADLWSNIITGDVRDDVDLNGNPVDDVNISINIGRIDGTGNPITGDVLAQTQVTAVRDPGSIDQWLPVTSSMTLDSTDLTNSVKQGWSGTWDSIIMHEMGHALGFFGLIFDNLGLVDSSGNFIGANAVAAYGNGTSVPVEQDGGSGTAGSHWDEVTFAPNGVLMPDELMTGYIAQNEQTLLSDTTVGAMADLGYHVQDPSVGSSYLTIDNHLLLA
jgi:hypothetical protein